MTVLPLTDELFVCKTRRLNLVNILVCFEHRVYCRLNISGKDVIIYISFSQYKQEALKFTKTESIL